MNKSFLFVLFDGNEDDRRKWKQRRRWRRWNGIAPLDMDSSQRNPVSHYSVCVPKSRIINDKSYHICYSNVNFGIEFASEPIICVMNVRLICGSKPRKVLLTTNPPTDAKIGIDATLGDLVSISVVDTVSADPTPCPYHFPSIEPQLSFWWGLVSYLSFHIWVMYRTVI